ncbi:MAG: hypothetical protein PHR45_04925 [Muribaculaceae bacterium]|nr:hypothetical protein [Muribaculaceae bacterium]
MKNRFIILIISIIFSINLCEAQEHFSRGIEQHSFVPKGQIVAGLSASYSQSKQDNYQFLIIEGISGDSYSVKVSPMVCYIFKDNMGVGGRLAYTRTKTKLDKATIVIDSETDYSMDNMYSISQKASAMGVFRNYISLGDSKRFGIIAEMQLEFGMGESKITSGSGTDFTGTFKRDYSLDIGLSPGLVVFLSNYSALEVNVGVLGFGYTHSKLITDQIHVANLKTTSANFKINLFSISFGVAFYL